MASRTSGNDEHVDRLKQFALVFCAARVLLFCLGPSDRATATHRAFAEQDGTLQILVADLTSPKAYIGWSTRAARNLEGPSKHISGLGPNTHAKKNNDTTVQQSPRSTPHKGIMWSAHKFPEMG